MTECIDGGRTTRAGRPLHAAVVYDSDDTLLDRAGRKRITLKAPGKYVARP